MFERIHIPLIEGWEEESRKLQEEDDAIEEASENEEDEKEDFVEDLFKDFKLYIQQSH